MKPRKVYPVGYKHDVLKPSVATDTPHTDVPVPIPMLLWCPECGERHVDRGEYATHERAHATHACQFCGMCWKPALIPTVGVQFLPGYKDES